MRLENSGLNEYEVTTHLRRASFLFVYLFIQSFLFIMKALSAGRKLPLLGGVVLQQTAADWKLDHLMGAHGALVFPGPY